MAESVAPPAEPVEAAPRLHYEDSPEWEKALRAIVVAGELGCPGEGLALVARKALTDCGVPFDAWPSPSKPA